MKQLESKAFILLDVLFSLNLLLALLVLCGYFEQVTAEFSRRSNKYRNLIATYYSFEAHKNGHLVEVSGNVFFYQKQDLENKLLAKKEGVFHMISDEKLLHPALYLSFDENTQ